MTATWILFFFLVFVLTNFNSADCHFESLYHSRRFIPSSDQRQPFTPESHQSLQITLKSHRNHTKLFKSHRNHTGITPVFPLPPFNFHYTFFMGCCGIFLLTVIQGYWTKDFFAFLAVLLFCEIQHWNFELNTRKKAKCGYWKYGNPSRLSYRTRQNLFAETHVCPGIVQSLFILNEHWWNIWTSNLPDKWAKWFQINLCYFWLSEI